MTSNPNYPLTEVIPVVKDWTSKLETQVLFSHSYTNNFHEATESVLHKCVGKYFLAMKSGDIISSNFSEKINHAILDDVKYIGVVYKEDNPLFYLVNAGYIRYGKKDGTPMTDVIKELAEYEGTNRVFVEYGEIVR